MGIKNRKINKLASFLPLKLKHLYVKVFDIDMEHRKDVFWSGDEVMQFRLDGFNDDGLDKAFLRIVDIYDKILYKDPNWHYFYEGDHSLIRCSFKYVDLVETYLKKNGISYVPPDHWEEGTYTTVMYKDIYKHIFHSISVLMIQMYKNDDGRNLLEAGDRVIHPFFNHGFYLAKMAGMLDKYKTVIDAEHYEADMMMTLARDRTSYIGYRRGVQKAVDYYEGLKEENNGKNGS